MAYRKGENFHGVHYRTPGTYSYVESQMRQNMANGAKRIAIIGECTGGLPGEINFIDGPDVAKQVLKGGELLDAVLMAYDPVVETKVGVELGGADMIFAIRSNKATKALTNIYQEKTVEAKIGEVVKTVHPTTTSTVTASGTYTGEDNKTFVIEITSDGTKDLSNATYSYSLAKDGVIIEENLPLSETKYATNKELSDGVTVSFTDGKLTKGDKFIIPVTAKVTEEEFVYTIESKDYGKANNFISHKLEDGTIAGTKKLSIYDTKNDYVETFDNIGAGFDIAYTGDASYATMTITANGAGDSIKLQTYIGESEETAIVDLDIELDKGEYKSVRQLALNLAAYENYNLVIYDEISYDLTVSDLDFADKVNIKESYPVRAVLRDIKKTCNYQSDLVEVNIINREVSNYSNYEFTSLTGGSEGLTPNSFINYLDKLGQYDIDYIVPLTDDLETIAECREHVINMSERHSKERRLVCGIGTTLSVNQLLQNVKKLAHSRVQYVASGFYDLNGKLHKAYIAAAAHAGRAAFLNVESATHDVYKMLKPAKTFSEIERNKLIDNGVLFFDELISDIDHKRLYSRLCWDYTTFTDFKDPYYVERSTGAIGDDISKTIRRELDVMLTGKLTPVAVLESAKNRILSILKDYLKRGIILAYGEVSIKKKYDRTDIRVEIAPTQVNNFTFIDLVFVNKDLEV